LGKPEVTGLGAMILYRGASSVISSSRVCWMSHADPGGIPYHFYDRLMKDTTSSHGIIGTSYDIARTEFMNTAMFWLPAYHYNLFGDPALRQFGRLVNVEEANQRTPTSSFVVYPNPTFGQLIIRLNSTHKRKVKLDVYDESGQFVQQLYSGYVNKGIKYLHTKLPAGVYFLRLNDINNIAFRKLIVINR